MIYLGLLALGLCAGVLAGMFGIGGGLIMVPALIYIFQLRDLQAIATSLAAQIPPVALLGAIEHYRAGNVNVRYAVLIAIGLFFGAFFGAKIIISMPPAAVKRIYAAFLLIIGLRMLVWGK